MSEQVTTVGSQGLSYLGASGGAVERRKEQCFSISSCPSGMRAQIRDLIPSTSHLTWGH